MDVEISPTVCRDESQCGTIDQEFGGIDICLIEIFTQQDHLLCFGTGVMSTRRNLRNPSPKAEKSEILTYRVPYKVNAFQKIAEQDEAFHDIC